MDESDLTKKIGPLPVWAWGAIIVVGGLAIKTILARRKAANQPVASTVAGTTDASSVADTTASPSGDSQAGLLSNDPFAQASGTFLTSDPTNPAFPTYTSPSGGTSAITDAQWGRQAQDYLDGLGSDPAAVSTAISNYLNGLPVTSQGKALINQALNKFGALPEGVLPITVVDPAAPVATPAPAPIVSGPKPAPVPAPAPAGHTGPTIRQGSSGSAVSTLQSLLNSHGYHLTVDGKFGPATKAAVMAFQAAQGIGVDGIVGPITWSRL